MLQVSGLTKSFGGVRAVRGLDLSLGRGEILGLIGPNGSGKTTTINLLTGIYRPDGGSVALKGRDVTALTPNVVVRAGMTRTFQNLRLFLGRSVLDNIRIAQTLHCGSLLSRLTPLPNRQERQLRDEAEALADRLGLAAKTRTLAGALSYGERKRVEIARALATRPDVLLLDEPAAGMNPVEVDWLSGVVRSIRADGIGIILIEHHMKLVMSVCDRITVLSFGQKIAEGTPSAVAADPTVIEAYLGKAP